MAAPVFAESEPLHRCRSSSSNRRACQKVVTETRIGQGGRKLHCLQLGRLAAEAEGRLSISASLPIRTYQSRRTRIDLGFPTLVPSRGLIAQAWCVEHPPGDAEEMPFDG